MRSNQNHILRSTVAGAMCVLAGGAPVACGSGDEAGRTTTNTATAAAPVQVPGGRARTPKRYRFRLIGTTFIIGPRTRGPRGNAWGVYFRTDHRVPLTTTPEQNRHVIRLRDQDGDIVGSSDPLNRFAQTPRNVYCYEAPLDARPSTPLGQRNAGDKLEVSFELLTEYPEDVGTRLARPQTRTVRAGDDPRATQHGLDALGCGSR